MLEKTGVAFFGNQWQTDLAKALKVTSRTVRRWASGESDIPKNLANELQELAKYRNFDIKKAVAELTIDEHSLFVKSERFGVIEFHDSKETAMEWALRFFRPSKFKDVAVIPYFAVMWVIDSETKAGRYFYAMQFMPKLENRCFNEKNKLNSCYWHPYFFADDQAGVLIYNQEKKEFLQS